MKWIEAKVRISGEDTLIAMDLAADLFLGMGLKGVVIQEPELELQDGDVAPDEDACRTKDANVYAVTGYLPMNALAHDQRHTLESGLQDLRQRLRADFEIIYGTLDDEDWAEAWKAHFHPLKIGRHIVIKPTWRTYAPEPGDMVIEIDPGMAFGTGTHPTTAMCLELVETFVQPDSTFLDVGTGSGILMIAAARLGARQVWGVDNDPIAVEIALANLALNQVPPERFQVTADHPGSLAGGTFDVIAVNILLPVVQELLDSLALRLAPGGILLCSGVLGKDREALCLDLERVGLKPVTHMAQDEWIAIAARQTIEIREAEHHR